MEVHPCPICGRKQSRGGVPFYDESQTLSHIDGAHDAQHKGERGADYEEEVREGRTEVEEEEVLDDTHGEDGESGAVSLTAYSELLAGEEPIQQVVEVHGEALKNPEDFGIASGGDVSTLIQQNAQLRQQNDDLRRSVEELYEAVDALAESAGASLEWEEREVYDPVAEFEEA